MWRFSTCGSAVGALGERGEESFLSGTFWLISLSEGDVEEEMRGNSRVFCIHFGKVQGQIEIKRRKNGREYHRCFF